MDKAVRCLHPLKAGGHTHLRVEHFKQWLRVAYPGENSKKRTERWMCLVDIIQHMWQTGEIPQDLGWNVLVLIPKWTTYTWGIGLLETLWKLVEALIDTRIIASIQFHDVLHGLWAGRGTEMYIMELKLAQELSRIGNDPLLLVFLDLRKAYNTAERDRLIQTLERYGAGPCMCRILDDLWAHQQVVPRQNGYNRIDLKAKRGMA